MCGTHVGLHITACEHGTLRDSVETPTGNVRTRKLVDNACSERIERSHLMLGILFSCLALSGVAIETPDRPPAVDVMYVANEGFLIEIGSKRILIDAMIDHEPIAYNHVPDEDTLSRMRNALPPFDDLDLLLVTHFHRDHFSSGPVLDHLRANPTAVLVAPTQAVTELRVADPELDRLGARIRELSLELFESADLTEAGIRVRAMRFRHSRYLETDEETGAQIDRHAGVENLVYLIEVDGVKLVHLGDAVLSQNLEFFENGQFLREPVNIAVLEFFDWSEATQAVLDRWLKPDHIIFMHLPPEREKSASRVCFQTPSSSTYPSSPRRFDPSGTGRNQDDTEIVLVGVAPS
jgi:L-ascorbate metabolism protein UlaG (beta-lactamase superfamily)